jgi:branched-chain amino acid transport system permease protein
MNTLVQLVVSGILIGGVYALMSLGLTLIFGVLRVVNFAHGEFLMVAMYGAWAMTALVGFNPYVAILVVVPAMVLAGGLVHRLVIGPGIEKPHLVLVFATMGVSILLQNLALMIFSADLRDIPPVFARSSLPLGPIFVKPELLIAFLISCISTFALMWAMKATFIGKAVRATVQDREAAMLMGIPVPRIFLLTFAVGSGLIGLAACVMTPLFSTFPTVGLNFVLIAFVVVVLGGMGSVEGAFLGGLGIGLVQTLAGYYIAPAYGQLFCFLVFLLVMIFRPSGLLGQKGTAMIGVNE